MRNRRAVERQREREREGRNYALGRFMMHMLVWMPDMITFS